MVQLYLATSHTSARLMQQPIVWRPIVQAQFFKVLNFIPNFVIRSTVPFQVSINTRAEASPTGLSHIRNRWWANVCFKCRLAYSNFIITTLSLNQRAFVGAARQVGERELKTIILPETNGTNVVRTRRPFKHLITAAGTRVHDAFDVTSSFLGI